MDALGGIGQPLSLLLKLNPAVTKLALYDIVHTPGVAADISHCETRNSSHHIWKEKLDFWTCQSKIFLLKST